MLTNNAQTRESPESDDNMIQLCQIPSTAWASFGAPLMPFFKISCRHQATATDSWVLQGAYRHRIAQVKPVLKDRETRKTEPSR